VLPVSDRRPVPLVAVSAVVTVVSVVGVYVLWRVFVDTFAGQSVDQAAIEGAAYGQTQLWRVAEKVLDVVSVGFIAAVCWPRWSSRWSADDGSWPSRRRSS